MASRRMTCLLAVPLIGALTALAACGDDSDSSDTTAAAAPATTAAASSTTAASTETSAATATTAAATDTTAAAGGAGVSLKGICPDTISLQTDWNPESEHGMLYEMVGPGYKVDADKKRVSGPLYAGGKDTGIMVEVRSGGPAIGFQTVTSQIYSDPTLTLGYVATDEAIQLSAEFPTKAIVAPFNKNPQIIMWDPATYPNVKTIADLKATGAKVRYFGGAAYMEFLTSTGVLDKGQVDGSYDGTPANFVADGGKAAQQGFASAEPYIYKNEIKEWGKPIAYQLVHDAGWTAYAAAIAGKPDTISKWSDCWKKFVPIMQQAQVDYVKAPDETNKLILELVDKFATGWSYSEGVAKFSVETQLKDALVANSPDGTLGSFDMARLEEFLPKAVKVYKDTGSTPKDGVTVADLVTNEYIDKSIHL